MRHLGSVRTRQGLDGASTPSQAATAPVSSCSERRHLDRPETGKSTKKRYSTAKMRRRRRKARKRRPTRSRPSSQPAAAAAARKPRHASGRTLWWISPAPDGTSKAVGSDGNDGERRIRIRLVLPTWLVNSEMDQLLLLPASVTLSGRCRKQHGRQASERGERDDRVQLGNKRSVSNSKYLESNAMNAPASPFEVSQYGFAKAEETSLSSQLQELQLGGDGFLHRHPDPARHGDPLLLRSQRLSASRTSMWRRWSLQNPKQSTSTWESTGAR
ncbi:hypothetical protein GW17_00035794 [Ensete ventricosum]|nr:hypothetical protein GW17_00035794 [Ensete ventricosum]